MTSSVGMMTFHSQYDGKNEKMFQSTKEYNTYNPTYSQLLRGSYPWLQPTVSDGMMNLASMCCELVQSALVIL